MEALRKHQGVVMPLDRTNVDTDAIIPKQYLKSVKRTGFGPNLFDDWRYLTPGKLGDDHSQREKNMDFVMNRARYGDASILLARDNFGCGSSREHAVWALMQAGFRAVVAPSFAEIFYDNALRNGLAAVVLSAEVVNELFERAEAREGYSLDINLERMQVRDDKDGWSFEIDDDRRDALMRGLDPIGLTLEHADEIRRYEERRRAEAAWLFDGA